MLNSLKPLIVVGEKMPKIINLKEMAFDKEDILPLYNFFESQARIGINAWEKKTTYRFDDGREFSFQNDVFRRESRSKPG